MCVFIVKSTLYEGSLGFQFHDGVEHDARTAPRSFCLPFTRWALIHIPSGALWLVEGRQDPQNDRCTRGSCEALADNTLLRLTKVSELVAS